MRSPKFGNTMSLVLEMLGAVLIAAGVTVWLGVGPGLIVAGVLVTAAGLILDV